MRELPPSRSAAWRPSREVVEASNLTGFMRQRGFESYEALWKWSVTDRAGFWGAVFSSLLGVWQAVPYVFADFVRLHRRDAAVRRSVDVRGWPYRGFLLAILPPGAFIGLGLLIAIKNLIDERQTKASPVSVGKVVEQN